MTLHSAARPRPSSPDFERVQREHELNGALVTARTLQARLEILGDRALDVAVIVSLRHSLARDLVANGSAVDDDLVVTTPPCSASPRTAGASSSFSEAEVRHERLLNGDAPDYKPNDYAPALVARAGLDG